MKTIIFILLAIFLFGAIAPGFVKKSNGNYQILIQASDTNSSQALLSQSVKVINDRLENYSKEKFGITIIPEKKQIQVTLDHNWDPKIAASLILHKGTLAFYETYNYSSLTRLVKDNNQLLSLFHEQAPDSSASIIGCISPAEINKVNEYLSSLGLYNECKFAWNYTHNDSKFCLFALKLNHGNAALLSATNVEHFTYDLMTSKNNYEITFKFKPSATHLWSDLTKRNINRAVAFVLDDQVLSAPIVRSEINNGGCQITGNLTLPEVKYITVMGNSGELPLSFSVVK